MENVLFFLTFFLLSLGFQGGNATSECSVPGNTTLVYFDLEQLNLIALQQANSNTIQSPLLCEKGKDEECLGQQCCPEEVGCCLTSSQKNHIRKCGCKKENDEKCMYPAPYAILANTECASNKETKISACLRERRDVDVATKEPESKFYGPLTLVLSIPAIIISKLLG